MDKSHVVLELKEYNEMRDESAELNAELKSLMELLLNATSLSDDSKNAHLKIETANTVPIVDFLRDKYPSSYSKRLSHLKAVERSKNRKKGGSKDGETR